MAHTSDYVVVKWYLTNVMAKYIFLCGFRIKNEDYDLK